MAYGWPLGWPKPTASSPIFIMARSSAKPNNQQAMEASGRNHCEVWSILDEILPVHPRKGVECALFLESVPARMAAALHADWSAVCLLDQAGTLRAVYPFPGEGDRSGSLAEPAAKGVLAHFSTPGCRAVSVDDRQYGPLAKLMGAEPSGPLLCAPLICHGQVHGLFCAARRNGPDLGDEQRRLADVMADMVCFILQQDVEAGVTVDDSQAGNESPTPSIEGSFRAILENTGTAAMIVAADMTIVHINTEFEKLVRLPRDTVQGRMSWMDFCHPDDLERTMSHHRTRLAQKSSTPSTYETRLVDSAGEVRHVMVTASIIPGTSLSIVSMLDVSELKDALFQRDLQKAYFEQLFERIPLATVLVDPQDRVMAVNNAFERLFGFGREESQGRSINSLIVPPELADEATGISRQTQEGQLVFAESKRRTADGRTLDVSIIGTPVYVGQRQEAVFGIYQDVTEQNRTRQQLVYQANHDHLTGLSNRRRLLTRVGDAIRRGKHVDRYDFAVLFLDLNRFKVVNDSLGHLFGDAMLIIIARMLQDSLGDNGVVARLGGDDFGVLVEHPQVEDFVRSFVRRVQERLRTPFQVMGRQVTTSASVGVVFGRAEYARAEDYLRDASLAMQRAKVEANENCQVFDGRMHDHAMRRMLLESSLRTALDNQEFVMHYQPIVELVSGEKRGYEALIRWNRKGEGIVPPDEFIPLAEETGLIVPMGYWALERACLDFGRLCAPNSHELSLSVNISGKQFRDPEIYSRVKSILRQTGMPAERLRLEITESMLMQDPENVSRILSRLKNLGIKISVDDFGTGYSSLSYLSRFPIDVLKIDKAFVAPLEQSSPTAVRLVQTIITLGNSLGLEVVAEGVESSQHVSRLTSLGCSLGQGYLFARPASLADSGC